MAKIKKEQTILTVIASVAKQSVFSKEKGARIASIVRLWRTSRNDRMSLEFALGAIYPSNFKLPYNKIWYKLNLTPNYIIIHLSE